MWIWLQCERDLSQSAWHNAATPWAYLVKAVA